jgi:5-methylcytosine-specific restriction endonuclease McrA
MNYKEHGLTREQREQQQQDINDLRPYIMCLKKRDLGEIMCENCKRKDCPLDIHHKDYKPDLTYYDLQLLCEPCHVAVTDFRHVNDR